jgi:hypothetical protein
MGRPGEHAGGQPATLAMRLRRLRHQQFVGRADECARFAEALAAPTWPLALLWVFGPGGVGKTSLLAEFSWLAQQAQVPVLRLDARNVDASPAGFLAALAGALASAGNGTSNGTGNDEPLAALAALATAQGGGRVVLLLDTAELLAPLDNWLCGVLLPQMPAGVLVVLAGRHAPSQQWRSDWAGLLQTLPLRNLAPSESLALLDKRGVPTRASQAVLAFTHGHPLALSLVADTFDQRQGQANSANFDPSREPDVVRSLLARFVEQVPGPAHRAALEAASVVRVLTESLLQEMLTPSNSGDNGNGSNNLHNSEIASNNTASEPTQTLDAHALFEWLRTLSFIEAGPLGLFPHDLAREALYTDLRWRNPDWNRELHARARGYYSRGLQRSRGLEQMRLLFDDIYLHRENPMVKPFITWGEYGSVYGETPQASDLAGMTTLIDQFEGPSEAAIAKKWLEQQPQGAIVYRDAQHSVAGLMLRLALNDLSPAEVAFDPLVVRALDFMERYGPLRPGDNAVFFRFWLGREYQAVSPVQSVVFVNAAQYYLSIPRLAWSFFAISQPDFWSPAFIYMDLMRMPALDHQRNGRELACFGTDWRKTTVPQWLAMLGEREMQTNPETGPPPLQITPLVVLSQADFVEAVRDALRDYNREASLAKNPLLHSRLVRERKTQNSPTSTLQQLLKEAAAPLRAAPKDEKLYRALVATFFEPAMTQELAAERLNVPFSSYRRHLKAAIERITEQLWTWELASTN